MKPYVLPLALGLASPVLAQDRMDLETCLGGWNAVMSMVGTQDSAPPETSLSDDGWCVVRGLSVPMDTRTTVRVDHIRWRAADMARVIDAGLPPRSFEIDATGVQLVPQSGDAVLDYLLGLQLSSAQTGFGLNVRWDGVQDALFVEEAYFDFFAGNRIEGHARVDGVDLSDWDNIQTSAGSAGLRDLEVTADFDGWFEAYLAMMIGDALLESGPVTPEDQVAALQVQAVDFIFKIPESLLPETSRDALAMFIDALPRPRGRAQLQISADPVIGAARAMPFAMVVGNESLMDALPIALDGVTVLFTWSPTSGE